MRELLYIPEGKIIRFPSFEKNALISLETRCKELSCSEFEMLLFITCQELSFAFYSNRNLKFPLLLDEFEVIDIPSEV